MNKFCDNTYCETEAVEEVPVSVHRPGDQKRSLCATCFEAYTWGVQHGRITYQKQKVWVLVIADKGIIAHIQTFQRKSEAQKGLLEYLRNYEQYKGTDDFEEARQWVAEHDERLSVEITCQFIAGESVLQMETIWSNLDRFLLDEGIILLGQNQTDPHSEAPLEAWAYQGPRIYQQGVPITFGLGENIYLALEALDLRFPRE